MSPQTAQRKGARRVVRGPFGMHEDGNGFDVTCVIGQVRFDPDGDLTPYQHAFQLIGAHQAPGTFRFPAEDGNEVIVSVEYTGGAWDGK